MPANLRLNTQRKSAPSMRAFKEEERSVLISVTLLNERNYRVQNCTNYWHHVHYVRVQPCDSDLKERFLSFVCLIIITFCHPHFSFFFLLLFLLSAFFFLIRTFLSAFSHPHPPSAGIRSAFYRHPFGTAVLVWCGKSVKFDRVCRTFVELN